MQQTQTLIDQYWSWLREKTTLKQAGDWTEVTTPFLDRHNDHLQVFVKREGNSIKITDDGYILGDLRLSGCDLSSRKRQDILQTALNGYGVKLDGDALVVQGSPENFPSRKHNLIQAMLTVNDMFFMASATVESLFLEDVENWLLANEIRFTPRVKFTGKSGYDHLFDFVIPASRKAPERVIQAINRPRRETAEHFVLAWIDTRDVRSENSQAYAFLNDSDVKPSGNVIEALENYQLKAVPWSERNTVRNELSN